MPSREPDIKIFVSRRIDVDSILVPNPLYIPVRCGAALELGHSEGVLGDDTGDNISEKRGSFCEFTVQYWVWKNQQADYYGLCHYRRYLAFAEGRFRANDHGLVPWPELTAAGMRRFGLLDEDGMRRAIGAHALVVPKPAPVSRMPLPHGRAGTVRELWEAHQGIFFDNRLINRLFQLINRMAPQFMPSARAYFSGGTHRGYNCYVMERTLFDRLCRFQFPIMEALEAEGFGAGRFPRAPAYAGEMLFGIFCHHAIYVEGLQALELPLILFAETEAADSRLEQIRRYVTFQVGRAARCAAAPLFPLGSRRREWGKRTYRRLICGKNETR